MLGIFILVVLFSYLVDKFTVNCKFDNKKIELVRLLHHFIATYGYFGSIFFGHYLFHMCWVLVVYMGWSYFKIKTGTEYCFITKYVNNICGIPEGTLFHDLMWLFPKGFKDLYQGVVLYDYYKVISS